MDLQQRAHVNWLTKEDQGSKFFAQAIKARHARNSILGTLDMNGIQTNTLAAIKERAVNYFSTLYMAPNRSRPISNLNIIIEDRSSMAENAILRAVPSIDEIWNVIKSLPKAKAPGIDGLTVEFLLHHWGIMKDDFLVAILHFFNSKHMLRSLNLATLTLIPKIQLPE